MAGTVSHIANVLVPDFSTSLVEWNGVFPQIILTGFSTATRGEGGVDVVAPDSFLELYSPDQVPPHFLTGLQCCRISAVFVGPERGFRLRHARKGNGNNLDSVSLLY